MTSPRVGRTSSEACTSLLLILPLVMLLMTATRAVATGWLGIGGPSNRNDAGFAFDPVRRQLILIGGETLIGVPRRDAWRFDVATERWSQPIVSGDGPEGRAYASAVYDSSRDCLWYFGGTPAPDPQNVWKLSLGANPTWTKYVASGASMPALEGIAGAFDTRRDRILAFGGFLDGTPSNDVFEFSPATVSWRKLPRGAFVPSPRARAVASYDPFGDQLIVTGGTLDHTRFNGSADCAELALGGDTAWTALRNIPAPRWGQGVVVDRASRSLMLMGGNFEDQFPQSVEQVFVLPLPATPGSEWTTWNAFLSPDIYPNRSLGACVIDPATRRVYYACGLFPKRAGSVLSCLPTKLGFLWTEISPGPFGSEAPALAWDSSRQELVVEMGVNGYPRGTWSLDASSAAPRWSLLPVGGTLPIYESGSMFYDAPRDRMVMYFPDVAETWALPRSGPFTGWTKLPISASPSNRSGPSLSLDTRRNRLMLFGGLSGTGLNDVYMLDLATAAWWSPVATVGTPPAGRWYAAVAYDANRDRLLVFGGGSYTDLWELTLSGTPTWRQISYQGVIPANFYSGAGAFDDQTRRFYVVGSGVLGMFDLTDPVRWSMPPVVAEGPDWGLYPAVAHDASGHRLFLHGGSSGGGRLLAQTMVYSDPVPVEVADGPRSTAPPGMAAWPNPFRASVRLSWRKSGEMGRIEVVDLAGRVVRQLSARAAAGRCEAEWDGRDAGGKNMPAGVYHVRAVGATDVAVARILLIH